MGIGLTAVKHLVELHRGQVWVESEMGQGSTFFVQLPKIQTAPSKQLEAEPAVEKGFVDTKIEMMAVK